MKDPGSFQILCIIGEIIVEKALCDLGASINLMSLTMMKRMKIEEAKPTRMALQLADRSFKFPHRIVEDLLVKVGNFIFPADFVVLDMKKEAKASIILGRSFLATIGNIIDVQKSELTLRLHDEKMVFNVFKAMSYPQESLEECMRLDVGEIVVQETFEETLEEVTEEDSTLGIEVADIKAAKVPIPSTLEERKKEKEAPKLELKALPSTLKYAYLGSDESYPVIINSSLSQEQEEELIKVLQQHQNAIGWTLADLKGISPSMCMHKILLEEDAKPSIQPQRRLNPAMKEVVQKEVMKLWQEGVIYPISDSPWIIGSSMKPQGRITSLCPSWIKLPAPPCSSAKEMSRNQPGSKLGKVPFHGHLKGGSWVQDLQKGHWGGQGQGRAPIITPPDWNLPFEPMCDASDFAIGAVLGQRKDNLVHVIYYASKVLNDIQKNYTTTEKELLARVFAFDKFKSYLIDSKEFNIEIRDKKGEENKVVDHLSRIPCGEESTQSPSVNESFPDE
ncbi:uncharacterized protein LOC107493724 [Arachis duranensis]|uniref:Uncharacterized protein LOC107493724 n=1 Tax=Arachis duranensis TaxID=130453 RepID=A0A6P4DS91_ARADU|nr:uncharacterized protein LOC107493724 [Arachis duranensis]